jgi:hypothetical protein
MFGVLHSRRSHGSRPAPLCVSTSRCMGALFHVERPDRGSGSGELPAVTSLEVQGKSPVARLVRTGSTYDADEMSPAPGPKITVVPCPLTRSWRPLARRRCLPDGSVGRTIVAGTVTGGGAQRHEVTVQTHSRQRWLHAPGSPRDLTAPEPIPRGCVGSEGSARSVRRRQRPDVPRGTCCLSRLRVTAGHSPHEDAAGQAGSLRAAATGAAMHRAARIPAARGCAARRGSTWNIRRDAVEPETPADICTEPPAARSHDDDRPARGPICGASPP